MAVEGYSRRRALFQRDGFGQICLPYHVRWRRGFR
ncbi:MAG: hypothetical protein HQK86_02860 [Nitrospinae bacterium]|nr:hypothetical protein [Nitrospinota bacterium]